MHIDWVKHRFCQTFHSRVSSCLKEDCDDEVERTLTIAILKRSVTEALNHIDIVEQELEILAMSPPVKEVPVERMKKPMILTIVGYLEVFTGKYMKE